MPKPISKSQFNLAQQCGKAFYLYRHRKELLEHSEAQLQVMRSGTSFGELMQGRYPGGVDVSRESADFPQRIQMTDDLIQSADKPIYEASLSAQVGDARLLCMVDIMLPTENGGWHLIEVKSGSSLKEPYIADAYFQCFVAQSKGVEVDRLSVLHVNNKYVRQGELDIHQLGVLQDLDLGQVPDYREELEELLQIDEGTEPDIPIGRHCTSPYSCGFMNYCWSGFPKKDNVFHMLSEAKAMQQVEQGIYMLDEVDAGLFRGRRKERYEAWRNDEWIWKEEEVNSFLNKIEYPAYYLDFETYNSAIPAYEGHRPYQQTCFQYSLHIQQEEGGQCEHIEFLARPEEGDPQKYMMEHLVKHIGQRGSVIVYNATFEKTRLKEMGQRFPEYALQAKNINARMLDLLDPFKSVAIYYPNMGRSASLKVVLPELVPELSYSVMEVADGGMAMNTFQELMTAEMDEEERAKKREGLLRYCELDTWAMVKLVERMQRGI